MRTSQVNLIYDRAQKSNFIKGQKNKTSNQKSMNEQSIISQHEFSQMKVRAQYVDMIQLAEQQHQDYLQKRDNQEKTIKSKFMNNSTSLTKITNLSEYEQAKQREKQRIIENAKNYQIQNLDEVKQMNKMVKYAKCVTVRDSQLEDKVRVERDKKIYDKYHDMVMEVQRLKLIKHIENKKIEHTQLAKKDHEYLTKQIIQRKEQRRVAQAILEQESKATVQRIQNEEIIEKKQIQNKKNEQFKILGQIENDHKQQKEFNKQLLVRDKEEAIKRQEYIKNRDLMMKKRQEDEKQKFDQRQQVIQKISDMQLQASDQQAELDALRAKRATEEKEMQFREQEKKNMQQRIQETQELLTVRKQQQMQKQQQMKDMAQIQKQDFEKQTVAISQTLHQYDVINQQKKQLLHQNQDEVQKQITENQQKNIEKKRQYLQEGIQIKDDQKQYRSILDDAKKRKLNNLKDIGISVKYQSELAKVKAI